MKPIKLALKNITKLNKFIFIFVNLCPWVLGYGEGSPESTILKAVDNIGDPNAYQAFLEFARGQKDENGLHLFFFDVGHGNFILVRDKDNAMIVDAGGNKTADIMAYIKNLFETCLGNATLNQIIITHDHKDHTNYVEEVKKWGNKDTVQEISLNPFEFATIIRWQVPSGSPISNATLSFLKQLTVLQANSQDDEAIKRYENHRSSVFVLTYQGLNVLFTGDATGVSLDNYVEKHQGSNLGIVAANRELLKNIHLFVMPHHGSSTEDSFRWTLYVTKHSPNLLASVICGDPFVDKYKDVRNWVRDISWPNSMRNADINNFIYYWSARSEIHAKKTNTALFITGAEPCRCVYFKIQGGNLYKYDSTRKNFVYLNGSNTGLPLEDSYEAGEKVMPMADTMEEDETTTGEMMQMSNIPMNGGGFGMNTPEENTQKMEEVGLGRNDSFNFSPQLTPIKKLNK